MTQAPERIWARYSEAPSPYDGLRGLIVDNKPGPGLKEFVPADLPPTRNQIITDPRVKALVEALALIIYETTHLSPQEDDGSHWCKISAECLEKGRQALAAFDVKEKPSR
jgi:hypothetical protein